MTAFSSFTFSWSLREIFSHYQYLCKTFQLNKVMWFSGKTSENLNWILALFSNYHVDLGKFLTALNLSLVLPFLYLWWGFLLHGLLWRLNAITSMEYWAQHLPLFRYTINVPFFPKDILAREVEAKLQFSCDICQVYNLQPQAVDLKLIEASWLEISTEAMCILAFLSSSTYSLVGSHISYMVLTTYSCLGSHILIFILELSWVLSSPIIWIDPWHVVKYKHCPLDGSQLSGEIIWWQGQNWNFERWLLVSYVKSLTFLKSNSTFLLYIY